MSETVNCAPVGRQLQSLSLKSIQGAQVVIPDKTRLTHLQFRRFAGCPTCNLHMHSFIQRYSELVFRGIQEVVVFHSSESIMKEYFNEVPFPVVADPTRALAKEFEVEKSIWSVLNRKTLVSIVKGTIRHGVKLPERFESVLYLPADFLIGLDGRILHAKHGIHAYDQWSVDQLIELCIDQTVGYESQK